MHQLNKAVVSEDPSGQITDLDVTSYLARVHVRQNPRPRAVGSRLDCKFLQSEHYSTFRLYLINFVRS